MSCQSENHCLRLGACRVSTSNHHRGPLTSLQPSRGNIDVARGLPSTRRCERSHVDAPRTARAVQLDDLNPAIPVRLRAAGRANDGVTPLLSLSMNRNAYRRQAAGGRANPNAPSSMVETVLCVRAFGAPRSCQALLLQRRRNAANLSTATE